jgi:cytochrome b
MTAPTLPHNSQAQNAQATPTRRRGRLVVDAPTRAFHALMALSFAGAYATADSEHWRSLHVALGYALAGLLVLRALYALVGPRGTSLQQHLKKLAALPAWWHAVIQAARSLSPSALPWSQTQHLALAATVVGVMLITLPLVLSGLGTLNEWDSAWGGDLLSEVHEFLGEFMLGAVLAHVGLVLGMSLIRRTNLARRMFSGRIDGAGPDLVRANRLWLAALLTLSTLAFVIWQAYA